MKINTTIISTILFAILLISCNKIIKKNKNNDNNFESLKRYGIKSGIIKYRISGINKGLQTLYFDKWGLTEAIYENSESKTLGMRRRNNTLSLIKNNIQYIINLKDKTGNKNPNIFSDEKIDIDFYKLMTRIEKNYQNKGGKLIGTEKIMNKICRIWLIGKKKYWIWKGINLKYVSNVPGGRQTIEAIHIRKNTKIEKSKFIIPEDIAITTFK